MEQPRITSIGKYEILSEIGRGAMGVVYRAQDPLAARQVAIKITKDLTNDTDVLQRLYLRFQPIRILDHPNIVPVYDIGDIDGQFYVVRQLIEGENLDTLTRGERLLPLLEKIAIIRNVCAGLGYAHRKGVLHEDIKPSKVMVRKDGDALLDFGTPLNFGGLIGFQAYISPERLKGLPHDGRSDIFAAGIISFQLLTGNLPFRGPQNYIFSVVNDKQLPLSDFLRDYPAELDDILDRSLAKDPADRYQSAEDMAAHLSAVIETLKHEATTQ